ncbi:uncharacterized protein LY89DRAFT_734992 [Mollisia scopiformis]|uniref:Uncharacterized protein n=1 Tax=Mollisia scopiformis TaxID=149040 RepID=A0A194X6P5_MOLSC|nr:uncharacterized protein LY89DRAFT_734992 [Mollisia scopiformis]KUJ15846.1 hypothetical protein LY89DRAFT_734992 [Mollisia scopiformis]
MVKGDSGKRLEDNYEYQKPTPPQRMANPKKNTMVNTLPDYVIFNTMVYLLVRSATPQELEITYVAIPEREVELTDDCPDNVTFAGCLYTYSILHESTLAADKIGQHVKVAPVRTIGQPITVEPPRRSTRVSTNKGGPRISLPSSLARLRLQTTSSDTPLSTVAPHISLPESSTQNGTSQTPLLRPTPGFPSSSHPPANPPAKKALAAQSSESEAEDTSAPKRRGPLPGPRPNSGYPRIQHDYIFGTLLTQFLLTKKRRPRYPDFPQMLSDLNRHFDGTVIQEGELYLPAANGKRRARSTYTYEPHQLRDLYHHVFTAMREELDELCERILGKAGVSKPRAAPTKKWKDDDEDKDGNGGFGKVGPVVVDPTGRLPNMYF